MNRFLALLDYFQARLSEQTTWQGIGFLVAASGSHFGAGLDWGQAAAIGGSVPAILKILLADKG